MFDLHTVLGSLILLAPSILWMVALLDKPQSKTVNSHDDEVVTYDDLIEAHHQALLDDVDWTSNYAAELQKELDNA